MKAKLLRSAKKLIREDLDGLYLNLEGMGFGPGDALSMIHTNAISFVERKRLGVS